jgi:hypothetical protein
MVVHTYYGYYKVHMYEHILRNNVKKSEGHDEHKYILCFYDSDPHKHRPQNHFLKLVQKFEEMFEIFRKWLLKGHCNEVSNVRVCHELCSFSQNPDKLVSAILIF